MADERIDIEVNDKVSTGPEKKLRAIGDAAGDAHNYVERLKNELASLNTTALLKMEAASNSTTRALAQQMNAQARLTTATAQSAVADAKAATEKQRLATETARTEAATARAAAAQSNAATAALRAATAAQRAADSTSSLSARADRLKSSLDPAYAAQMRFNAEMGEARTLLEGGAINMRTYVAAVDQATNRLNAAKGAQDTFNTGVNRIGQSAGAQRANMANLAAQINDIGVSLASGQNPFIVFIQQGSQISQIAGQMEGGFKALTVAALRMLAPFAPLAIAVGGLYVGFKSFTDDIAAKHKPELEAYANSLGLTEKEMNKLGNTTVGANGKLKEFDTVTITMADSWNGFVATVKEGLAGLFEPFSGLTSYFSTAWDAVMKFLYYAFIGFYGSVVGGMRALVKIVANLPSVAGETAKAIANATIAAIEFLVNKSIDGLNVLIEGADAITSKFGIDLGRIGNVQFGRFARSGQDAFDIIGSEATGAMREADRTLTAFSQRWEANSVKAARDRIRKTAEAIVDNRTAPRPKKESTADPKDQTDYINDTNKALDNELARMKMLKDAREVQGRLDQIEQEFLKRRMPLDEAQLKVFRDKIQAINDYKYVQSELDRIVEEAQGPQRTYNATLQAAKEALDQNAISQAQYQLQLGKASRALAEATDPLLSFKDAIETSQRALGLYGQAVEQNNYLESIRQKLVAEGYTGDELRNKLLSEEVQNLVAKNNALLQQQQINSTIGEIVNPMLERDTMLANETSYYAELQRLRDEDVLNAQQYEQAKYALQAKFSEMKLQGAASFFSELAGLQSSSSRTLATIGKAAAIADATIKGYQAAQNALATVPYPFNIAAAAAIAIKTGANVAAIASTNVGSYQHGGQFMVEGRAGIDNNNINMNVSRGERVTIETPYQQRQRDGGGNGDVYQGDVKIVNQFDEREFVAAMDSDEGERIILNVIKRNPNAVKSANNS
ncbi:tail tape measure protein [Sphingomonas phage Kharn]|uniref:Tail tape measure protein n=1 Tax=Sphingomonas phage Kharn TaxID=2686312 RepID=A0A6M3T879_9CAUD|nr:tail tape measure protein [Sphingomonas phage Kharn]QJD54516.1 tail tape measure protein [Sphingomonas phage Kharn]